jgi:hypothetical protein
MVVGRTYHLGKTVILILLNTGPLLSGPFLRVLSVAACMSNPFDVHW